MNDAGWERLTDSIDIKLGIDRHGKDVRPLEDRPELHEEIEFIEFTQNGKPLRLERVTAPAILDRKSHFSHRPGTASRVENFYSPTEKVQMIKLFRQADGEWQAVDVSTLEL